MIGIRIKPLDEKGIRFLRNNLKRIGIAKRREKTLFPSCYLFIDKKRNFYICHFKELLEDNRVDDHDIKRRNTITWLLQKWGLLEIDDLNYSFDENDVLSNREIFVLKHDTMVNDGWKIKHKFSYYNNQ
jgi:hypothetical protein